LIRHNPKTGFATVKTAPVITKAGLPVSFINQNQKQEMATYRFRVTFEEHEDVYREIEIKVTQTYEDFHRAIQEAIGFDNSKPASFFMSDDYWRKGIEIASEARKTTDEDDEDLPPHRRPAPVKLMSKTKIAGTIEDPHHKIIYVFDPAALWTLMIELIKIGEDAPKVNYPKCVKTVGIAPKQYKVSTLPPPVEEDDDIEDDKDKKEKAFHAEEAYDEENDEDEDALTEGDDDEPAAEGEEPAEEGSHEEDVIE
jgi:hypothetical protein